MGCDSNSRRVTRDNNNRVTDRCHTIAKDRGYCHGGTGALCWWPEVRAVSVAWAVDQAGTHFAHGWRYQYRHQRHHSHTRHHSYTRQKCHKCHKWHHHDQDVVVASRD